MTKPEGPQITGVRTVGVPVTDQEQALNFYVGTLGLDKRVDVPLGGGGRWIEVAPGGGGNTRAPLAAPHAMPPRVETGVRLTAGSADALHADLQARGVDVGEILRWPGVPPMFAFRDQDGNGLEIVEQAGP
jgi:catechol 2,3-dioxygenase-like lactoylglutathione lyase family enzyme